MTIDIIDCDLNNDYFHFTNKDNIYSILSDGLIPTIGTTSQIVGDRLNVSVSKGGKGIMGIINSLIYKFSTEISISEIPNVYRKYFTEISDFSSNNLIDKEIIYKAMIRKLKDEVYLCVELDDEQLEKARIGGLTGYDINLPIRIDKSKIHVITNSDNQVLSAYDVAKYIYEKAKDKEVFRIMHDDFFEMFEITEYEKDIHQDVMGKRK